MDETNIKHNYIFVGHGYIQHAGAEWTGSHCPSYHLYIVPQDNENILFIIDAIKFAYSRPIRIIVVSRDDEGEGDKFGIE